METKEIHEFLKNNNIEWDKEEWLKEEFGIYYNDVKKVIATFEINKHKNELVIIFVTYQTKVHGSSLKNNLKDAIKDLQNNYSFLLEQRDKEKE